MAGPEDFLPPSFWAASISCLFLSSSSICFFLAWASASFFSCSSLLIFSSSALFWAACFFSCSARISFLAACLSFNLLSSASSLARSSLHWLMYSRSWSFISDFFCWSGICANHCLLVLKLAVSEYLIEVQIVDCQESFDGAVLEGEGGGSLKLYSGSERVLERKVLSWGRNGCRNHSLNGEEMPSHPFRTSVEEKQLA